MVNSQKHLTDVSPPPYRAQDRSSSESTAVLLESTAPNAGSSRQTYPPPDTSDAPNVKQGGARSKSPATTTLPSHTALSVRNDWPV